MTDDTILVTGVSGSIGGALMKRCSNFGYKVIAVDKVPIEQPELPNGVSFVQADLNTEEGLKSVLSAMELNVIPKHIFLVHGGATIAEVDGDPLGLDFQVFRDTLESNLVSVYSMICALTPYLEKCGSCERSFVLASSINAFSSFGYPAYSSAKAGLESLVKSLSKPLAAKKIRINAIALGTVLDPRGSVLHSNNNDHFRRMRDQSLVGRVMNPDEAAATLYCMAESLVTVTGQVLVADYGQSILRFGETPNV